MSHVRRTAGEAVVDFRVDVKGHADIRQKLEGLGRKAGVVIARAINRVALAMRTKAVKVIRTYYNVKAADLKGPRGIHFTRANRYRLYSVISVAGTRLSLIYFGAREIKGRGRAGRGAGVSAMVIRGRRIHLRRAFIRRLRYGEAVVERKTKARYPILPPFYSLSIPAMLRAIRVRRHWEDVYEKKMIPELRHQIRAELEGYVRSRWEE